MRTLLAVSLALAFGSAILGCTHEVPANPTYTNDVRPIFVAHCVRCHGQGDMLNGMELFYGFNGPALCYLNRYESTGGDCSDLLNPACKHGAGFAQCVSYYPRYITSPEPTMRMPPPPSELTDWETETIIKWAANGAPQ